MFSDDICSLLVFLNRSINRTCACASTAINTLVSVDNVHGITSRNSIRRTFISASTAVDARVFNYISHFNYLL